MKKFLITAAIVLSCAVTMAPRASAQTASLQWTGVPASLVPGVPFTLGLNLVFTSGGGIPNLNGFSLWLWQTTGAPFGLMITDRNLGASIFTDLQTSNFNLGFPSPPGGGQIMDPINRQASGSQVNTDLGALSGPPQPSGTYFIGNFTFVATAPFVPLGFANTTSATPGVGGRISVINDSNGNTFPIAFSSTGLITVIPEPSSIALLCVGLMSAGAVAYRRRVAAR